MEVGHPDRYFLVYSVLPYMYWDGNFCFSPFYTTFRGEETLIKARKMSSVTRVIYYVYGRFFTCFGPKEPSSRNIYLKITKKSYWVTNGLYITDISVLQLSSLYSRVIWVCIDVIHIVDSVESR